jgi:hypothetical protein
LAKSVNTHLQSLITNEGVAIEYWNEISSAPDIPESLLSRISVIVLILSSNFLDSKIMKNDVIRTRLKMKQEGGFPIFKVIIDKCKWRAYQWLKELPSFPTNDYSE